MDFKIDLAFLMLLMCQASWAENTTARMDQELSVAYVKTPASGSTRDVIYQKAEGGATGRTAGSDPMSPPVPQTDVNKSFTPETSRPTAGRPGTSSSPTRKPKQTKTPQLNKDQELDKQFTYDYVTLRDVGLGVAGVLFLLGIMVLGCGRGRRLPRCRRARSKQSYQVGEV